MILFYFIFLYFYILKFNKLENIKIEIKNIIQKLHYSIHKGKNGNLKISDNRFKI